MAKQNIDRKIAVIFATDVVGYSKHMESDESETIHNLRECESILTKLFSKYDGRMFNTGGDSFLAEFQSAVSAVECAVEFQSSIEKRNSSEATSVKLQFRVGINSGDVVKEKDNLLGDGVNIASRLEALSQPNGITVSKVIYDYVKGKTGYEFNDIGIQKIKKNEFHAFDLILNASQKRKIRKSYLNLKFVSTVSFVLLLLIGFFGYISFQNTSNVIPPLENRISLLILPVEIKTENKDLEVLASGLNDQLSITLGVYEELYLFDTTSVEYFIENKISNNDLYQKQGVNYLLAGNLQSIADKSRVTLKLEDLKKNIVIWNKSFDFRNDEIFEVQDEISDAVLSEIIPNVMSLSVGNESTKNEFSPKVYLNRLKARVSFEKHTPEGVQEFAELLKVNRRLEPSNPYLDMDEAWMLMGEIWFGVSQEYEKNVKKAYELTLKVLSFDPDYPYALSLAQLLERKFLGMKEKACSRLDKMVNITNDPSILSSAGSLARDCGNFEQSLVIFKNIEDKAPHFRLWFKKDYAWTFLISQYMEKIDNFDEAKFFINNQLDKQFKEDGINEMWLIMLAYIASVEGDTDKAKYYFNEQTKMTNPINVIWSNKYPDILDENPAFRDSFFSELEKLGLKLK